MLRVQILQPLVGLSMVRERHDATASQIQSISQWTVLSKDFNLKSKALKIICFAYLLLSFYELEMDIVSNDLLFRGLFNVYSF